MMKVHNESDRMIQNAIEAKCKSENLLTQATHEQRRIMRENQLLLEQIQHLTAQIRASKQEMESYAEMANMERAHSYQRTIEELKQQLQYQQKKNASQNLSNAVPMNLYRSVVVEAKQYANQVQQQRMAIHTLENQILQLEEQTQHRQPQKMKSNRKLLSYPSILSGGFPSMISTTNTRHTQSTAGQVNNKSDHEQHRSTIPVKHPRPKTPLPMKGHSRHHNTSPIMEVPSSNRQPPPPPLLKSALKSKNKMTPPTPEQLKPNQIKTFTTHVSNTKAVHFNCSIDANEAAKSTKMDKFHETTATTPTSSIQRSRASSGPTPSRLNYTLSATTPLHKLTDSQGEAAVTPNTGGSNRNKENQLTRSQLRLSAVRTYGGRMGLQEKLRQVRRKHNVDETKTPSTLSPSRQRNNQASVLPSNSVHPAVKVESNDNKLEGKVSIDSTAQNNTAKEHTTATISSVAESTVLESYRTKLERMRIRPRQLGN